MSIETEKSLLSVNELVENQELDVSPEDWVPEHNHWLDMIDAEQDVFEEQLKMVLIQFQASLVRKEVQAWMSNLNTA